MENVVGRRLALLAGWGAALLFILDGPINAGHAPALFLVGVMLGPFCAWGAMYAAGDDGAQNRKLAATLELASAAGLAFYLFVFGLALLGVPGL